MEKCTDCGCTNFVEVESYLTCSYCGLVAKEGYTLVDDFCARTFYDTEFFEKPPKHEDVISKFEIPLNLSPPMMSAARDLLKDLQGSFRGESRTLSFAAAAVHFTSNRSIKEISEGTGLPTQLICKAVHEIFELQQKNKVIREKYNAASNNSAAANSLMNRLINKLLFVEDKDAIKIKCTTLKYYDFYAKLDIVKPFKDDKLMATFIFMACERLKIKEGTIKNVARACDASVPTLRNIYQVLQAHKKMF